MRVLRKYWKWHFLIWIACIFIGLFLMYDEHIAGNENKVITFLNHLR